MNPILLAVVSLRSAALALLLGGNQRASDSLYAVADAVEAGRASDAHMREVAEKLKSRDLTDADWDDVLARIQTDSDRLHSPGAG